MEIVEKNLTTGETVQAKNRISLQINEVNILNGILTSGFFSDVQTTELNLSVDNLTQITAGAKKFIDTDTDNYLICINFLIEY